MSDALTGYDMVAAITENTINGQLFLLTQQGTIHKPDQPILMQGFFTASLDIEELGYPQVSFAIHDSSYHDIKLLLTFKRGKLTAGNIQVAIHNWVFAFKTDMSRAPIPMSTIQTSPAHSKTAAAAIKSAANQLHGSSVVDIDQIFDIQYLFMNFENANLAEYDKSLSRFTFVDSTLSPDEQENSIIAFSSLLTEWLQNKRGTNNPWILGYSLHPRSQSVLSPSQLPTYVPTNATFSIFPNDKGLGTLNWLFVTGGRALPTDNQAGVFNQPWVSSNENQGVMAISRNLVIRDQLLGPLAKPFNLGPGDFIDNGTGYALTHSISGASDDKLDGGTITIGVAVQTVGGNEILVSYSYKKTKTIHVGEVDLGEITMTATWTSTFSYSTDPAGKITAAHTSTPVQKQMDVGEEWWQHVLELMPWFAIGKLVDELNEMKDFPNLKGSTWDVSDNQLALVLPGGDVFLFANARFDSQENLLAGITYSS